MTRLKYRKCAFNRLRVSRFWLDGFVVLWLKNDDLQTRIATREESKELFNVLRPGLLHRTTRLRAAFGCRVAETFMRNTLTVCDQSHAVARECMTCQAYVLAPVRSHTQNADAAELGSDVS